MGILKFDNAILQRDFSIYLTIINEEDAYLSLNQYNF